MTAVNAARGSDELDSPPSSQAFLHSSDSAGALVLPSAPFARAPRTSSSSSLTVRTQCPIDIAQLRCSYAGKGEAGGPLRVLF
jgi:hypothetical protein